MKSRKVMSHMLKAMVVLSLFVALLFPSMYTAQAATFQLSGTVTGPSSTPIANATVAVIDPSTSSTVASATTDSSGRYSLSVAGGTYNITVTPPSGSGFQPTTVTDQTISADTTLNFALVPGNAVTLSGTLLDGAGNAVGNAPLILSPAGGGTGVSATTDGSGHYAFHVAPGQYTLSGYDSNTNLADPTLPGYTELHVNQFSLTQDTTTDIQLPLKRVSVHVQDPAGNPVANVTLTTNDPPSASNLSFGTFSGYGYSAYLSDSGRAATTDSSGNATLWLFVPYSGGSYTVSANPPAGSPLVAFNVQDITFSSDTTEIVSLQYVHAPAVTQASLTPSPTSPGVYPGPVTVTLSAAAASGSTIANTYYTVDGGTRQTYASPFTIPGDGSHTITYWSVDSAGVPEAPNTLTFQIESLAITTDSPLPSGTVGVPYSVTLQASGGTKPYTWTIASGALPPGLTLDPSTGVISGTPTTAGTFGFSIQVQDSSSITATKQFTFSPPPPSGTSGSGYTLPISITPPSSGGGGNPPACSSYTLALGSGSLPPGLALDPTTGIISGTPTDGGNYTFTVQCSVSGGETVTKDFTITINNALPTLADLKPDSAAPGSGAFTLTLDGTNFVQSSTVQWNGSSRPTTYVSSTQLTAAIAVTDIASPGTASVTVVNPNPGGGTSNALTFTFKQRATGTGVTCTPSPLPVFSTTICAITVSDTDAGTPSAPAGTVSLSSDGNGTFSDGGSCTLSAVDGSSSDCTVAYTPSGVGKPTIMATYVAEDGLHSGSSGTTPLTVSQATPKLTWPAPADITYGTALGSTQLDATAADPTTGNALTGSFSYTLADGTTQAAGAVLPAGSSQTLKATFTPDDSTDYTTATGSVTINVNKALLSITPDDQTMTYGDSVPQFAVGPGGYSGLVNGDTPSVVSGLTCGATDGHGNPVSSSTPVGTYTITCSGGSAANYTISYTLGTLTITKAPLTVTADDKTMTLHGTVPALTATLSGFKNGETLATSGVTGSANCTTTADSSSPVGSYPITCLAGTLSAGNYSFGPFVDGALTIQYAPSGTCDGDAGHAILQPINANGSSVFKQGSTVPAKFRVCDANGVSIGTAGLVTSFLLVKTSSDPNTTVNETVTSTTPDTAFRWDATDQQWIFNISTKPLTSGSKYYYEITLNDGTAIDFSFALK